MRWTVACEQPNHVRRPIRRIDPDLPGDTLKSREMQPERARTLRSQRDLDRRSFGNGAMIEHIIGDSPAHSGLQSPAAFMAYLLLSR